MKYYCINCGKEISRWSANYGTYKCGSCWQLGKNNNQYRTGATIVQNYCIDCGGKIGTYSKRCPTCQGKINCAITKERFKDPKNHPMYGVHRFGKLNGNWQGGITPLCNSIRHLQEYYNWRNSIFSRDNYTCQHCGDNTGHNLNAHHKEPFLIIFHNFLKEYNQFSPIEDKETLVRLAMKYKSFWNINNGITLCEDCHKKELIETWKKIKEKGKINE